ncbi:MAG TPA: cytochrome-c peroxidase [Polyangiaceae bacterium]|nr:cytochrome-c peroxidase [Polyangiaceae bacterium]
MKLALRPARAASVLALVCAPAGCSENRTPPPRPEREAASVKAAPTATSQATPAGASREPLEALPERAKVDPTVVALGRRLFHEPRLSSSGKVACASCHDLAKGGVDGQKLSTGVGGQLGVVNAPTVYNAALNFVQFWDGRAATLEEQIGFPLTTTYEMGSSWDKALAFLSADPSYSAAFKASFSDGVTEANTRQAIADFERTLLTKNSPFDRYLAGDEHAISAEARTGYETFKSVGCIACHQGRNVGGNMFQKFGVLGDYFKDRGHVTDADYGRYNVTHLESDRFVFRVPSLRNVERTAPYFHDGSAATLNQAVQVMARYQLGRKLSDDQVAALIAFLKSLSGDLAPAGEKG